VPAVRIIGALAGAFLIGAIPWALLIGKWLYGVDVRTEGSGNLGATNVYRVLGLRAGLLTAILDVTKGAAAVGLAWVIVPGSVGLLAHEWALVGATVFGMLGHSYSPYVKFSGGKGVAVAAGGLLVLTPKIWPLLLLVFIIVIATTRYVSVGSMVTAVSFPMLVLVFYRNDTPTLIFSVGAAAIIVWRHSSNIRRLLKHEETKIRLRLDNGLKRKDGA
jgi:glycerol-3-phosphate acyltransferase PlsY